MGYRDRLMRGDRMPFGAPLRGALGLLEHVYAPIVGIRNRRYDQDPRRSSAAGVPVISVGNLTTGGTGKTPLVIDLVQRLLARGRRPAVISRGYKARRGQLGDELLLVQRRCPGVVCVADADRASAARRAVAEHGADCIVADDAFQHRRLARDLDIVVIDATNPFGYEHLLPRGLLREPIESLARADLIVISRADLVDSTSRAAIIQRIRAVTDIPVIHCRHRPIGFRTIADDADVDVPAGSRVMCMAAVGNPAAFEATVRSLGLHSVACTWRRDHVQLVAKEIMSAKLHGSRPAIDHVVMTEKDAVKLVDLQQTWPMPVAVLRIDLEFDADGGIVVDQALDRAIRRSGA